MLCFGNGSYVVCLARDFQISCLSFFQTPVPILRAFLGHSETRTQYMVLVARSLSASALMQKYLLFGMAIAVIVSLLSCYL